MFNSEKSKSFDENNVENIENNENESTNPFGEEINENQETEVQNTEEQQDSTQSELETLKSQHIRLLADFDNFRKRSTQERESLLKYGAEDTLKKLLPILDTFDRAKKSMADMNDPDKIRESFDVLYKQFEEALEKVGLKKIETTGKEFDPNFHEAVMQTPTNEHPDHTIITELQSGYQLGERVLRPALVNVAVNE